MSMAVSITYVAKVGSQIRVGFKLTPSGSYIQNGAVGVGEICNFATATQDAQFVGMVAALEAVGAPVSLDAWSNSGNSVLQYMMVKGSTPANCKVKILTAYNTELAAGTYAANAATALTDDIEGEATFNSL